MGRAVGAASTRLSVGLGSVAPVLIERRCAACGTPGGALCRPCVATFDPPPAIDPPDGLDSFESLVRYDGAARELVLALKYRNTRPALRMVARALAAVAAPHAPDAVTFAPTTAARRRERGYDQAQLLARGVARELRVPLLRALERRAGPPQTGRDRAERLIGPRLVARAPVAGSILVVDDVCTTGATLGAAAAALRDAGAGAVHGATFAVTPGAPPARSLKTATGTAEDARGGAVEPHDERNTDATD